MKTTARPRFSVVIPAFNEAHYIADTIDSLKRQHYDGAFEIIVVDNNSSDQTATIAKSLGATVVFEKHPGVCWARQAGTAAAKGEIIVSTDADTIFARDWLQKIDEQFKKHPKAVAVTGGCRFIGGPIWGAIYPYLLFGIVETIYKLTKRTVYASATNIAFKRDAFDGYNTSLTQGGDEVDVLRQLRKKGLVIFTDNNSTFSSSRRLARGLIYNLFVSFLLYYVAEYWLSRIFKRPVLGSAPKFRNELSPKVLSLLQSTMTGLAIVLFALYTSPGHWTIRTAHKFIMHTDHTTRRAVDKVRSL